MITLYGKSVYQDICIGKIVYQKAEEYGIQHITDVIEPVIIAAKELTPADTKSLPKEKIAGFLLEQGLSDSYAGMLAKRNGLY